MQEIADQSPAARPLRRRAGLLIGQWVGKLKGEDRPLAYRALLSLLADSDPAMQLAAVASLHALIDDWSVLPCCKRCIGLLQLCHLHQQQQLHSKWLLALPASCLSLIRYKEIQPQRAEGMLRAVHCISADFDVGFGHCLLLAAWFNACLMRSTDPCSLMLTNCSRYDQHGSGAFRLLA